MADWEYLEWLGTKDANWFWSDPYAYSELQQAMVKISAAIVELARERGLHD